MARGVFQNDAMRPVPPAWGKKAGAATLLLQGRGHKRDDDEDTGHQSTLRMLEVEICSLDKMPALGIQGKAVAALPLMPQLQLPLLPLSSVPPAEEVIGLRRRAPRRRLIPAVQVAAPQLPPVLPARNNAPSEALTSLNTLVATARNDAEYAPLLVSYYRGDGHARGSALSAWLASEPQNPFFWSRLHHRLRWRSPGRGRRLSLLEHAEANIPPVRQASRMLIYVKGWMAELDHQESANYRSQWLSSRSNRGNLARFFRKAENCALIGRYLEEVLAQRAQRGNLGEVQKVGAAVRAARAKEVPSEVQQELSVLRVARSHDFPSEARQLPPKAIVLAQPAMRRNLLAEAQEDLLRAGMALQGVKGV